MIHRLSLALEAALVVVFLYFGLQPMLLQLGLRVDPETGLHGVDLFIYSTLRTMAFVAVLYLVAWRRGQTLASFGLSRPAHSWPRTILAGLLFAFGMAVLSFSSTTVLSWFGLVGETSMFSDLSLSSRLGFLGVSFLGAGFGEELEFRGYLFRRAESFFELLKRPRVGWWCAALITSMFFGILHLYQGPAAVVVITLVGIYLCGVVKVCGGILWPVMLAHAFYDAFLFLIF